MKKVDLFKKPFRVPSFLHREKYESKIIVIMFFLLNTLSVFTQCKLTPVNGINYTSIQCGNYYFQQIVALNGNSYNQCGNNLFVSPLVTKKTSVATIEDSGFTIDLGPNPFLDKINLKSNIHSNAHVLIYNSIGKEVYSKVLNLSTETSTLDLYTLPPGIYILKVAARNQTLFSYKIIKI